MDKKLTDYFGLIKSSREAAQPSALALLKTKLRDINREIRQSSAKLADPSADIPVIVKKITELKNDQKQVLLKMANTQGSDRTSIKKRIVDTRLELLKVPYHPDWNKMVDFFKANPVALTAMMHQSGYDGQDRVQVLRTLPFRGRVSGPYGTRYNYTVKMADGTTKQYSSVRKIIVTLDQYNKEFRSLALTFEVLSRMLKKNLTIAGVKVAGFSRVTREK
jgi:hypothetical protein